MGSATSNLVEASFVSRVQGRVIQLFDESVHFADMKPNETVTVRTPPRRKWSARCGGVTVVLWPVPAGGAAFELGADAKLPQARSRRSVAGTRPRGRFSAESAAERPQWGGGRETARPGLRSATQCTTLLAVAWPRPHTSSMGGSQHLHFGVGWVRRPFPYMPYSPTPAREHNPGLVAAGLAS